VNSNLIIYLLFCHWVGDFVLQSDYMAQNKSKSNKALSIDCFVYGLTLGIMTLNPVFGLINGLIHFPVDYVTSRINSKLWAEKKVHYFFVSVGFDQWIHFVTMILSWNYLSK
jgi:Protein of unknown function (DUF3307)